MRTLRPVWSALGPVPVRLVELCSSQAAGEVVYGQVEFAPREIQIRKGQHSASERSTICHEWVHLVLWDSGLTRLLDEKMEEALCHALGAALAAAGALPFVKT